MPYSNTFSSAQRLRDDDPAQRYTDLFIALTVLEKLEVSYSKSLLSHEEYQRELTATTRQCHKAHKLIQHEFPTIAEFAMTYGRNPLAGNTQYGQPTTAMAVTSTHEFQRALVQLEGGDDLISGMREGKGEGRGEAGNRTGRMNGPSGVSGASGANRERPVTEKGLSLYLSIYEACYEVKEMIDAYRQDDFRMMVGQVGDVVLMLENRLGQLDEGALATGQMRDFVRRIRDLRERLDAMEGREFFDSSKLHHIVVGIQKELHLMQTSSP